MVYQKHNWLSKSGESVHNWFYGIGFVCRCEIKCPAARDEKTHTCPYSNSVFHAAAPAVLCSNSLIDSSELQ